MNKLEFIRPSYSAVKSVNGMTGDVVIEVPEAEVDLTGYATEEYVAKKIAEAELSEGDVDLSAYYTKSETDKKIEDAVAAIDVPEVDVDLTGYATEQFVNDAISTIELTPGPKGEDGYTPVKGVDYFDGKDGVDGAPGKDGADGQDYVLTDADKQEIAGMVEVTGGDGGSVEVDGTSIVKNGNTISLAAPIRKGTGTDSTEIGQGFINKSVASGDRAFAAVGGNASGNASIAIGRDSKATQPYAVAIGYLVTAESNNSQMVVGRYNKTVGANFIIGNGTDSELRNAMEVDSNNQVYFPGTVVIGENKSAVATMADITNALNGIKTAEEGAY